MGTSTYLISFFFFFTFQLDFFGLWTDVSIKIKVYWKVEAPRLLSNKSIRIFIYVSKMDGTVHITNKSEYGRMKSEDEEILQ